MNKTTLNSQEEKYSMLSLRRATFVGLAAHRLRNISIHALLAESDPFSTALRPAANISIHALLAESDPAGNGGSGSITAISIHALLAESDTKDKKYKIKKAIFLSTLSLRRATAREGR